MEQRHRVTAFVPCLPQLAAGAVRGAGYERCLEEGLGED